jgi:hypothetical protein
MNIRELQNSYRHDVIEMLENENNNIGVELGVAKGVFSSRMIESGRFSHFFGVDMYADMHDTKEYKETIRKTGLFSNYKLLRMTFDDAYDLFDDNSLDFIYVDGYAHNGEEGGKVIFDWSKKVKIGGIISGDDYHSDWPLVVEAVNEFIKSSGSDLYLTTNIEDNPYCSYPSWATIKKASTDKMLPSNALLEKGRKAKRHKVRFIPYLKLTLLKFMPKKAIDFLKFIKRFF